MKLEMFHLMPYRELPADFREQYHSVWVDVPAHLMDPLVVHRLYNDTLDELEFAANPDQNRHGEHETIRQILLGLHEPNRFSLYRRPSARCDQLSLSCLLSEWCTV